MYRRDVPINEQSFFAPPHDKTAPATNFKSEDNINYRIKLNQIAALFGQGLCAARTDGIRVGQSVIQTELSLH